MDSPFKFDVDEHVHVKARTWPGINKHGGFGKIKRQYLSNEREPVYDVKLVLGGSEKAVAEKYISPRSIFNNCKPRVIKQRDFYSEDSLVKRQTRGRNKEKVSVNVAKKKSLHKKKPTIQNLAKIKKRKYNNRNSDVITSVTNFGQSVPVTTVKKIGKNQDIAPHRQENKEIPFKQKSNSNTVDLISEKNPVLLLSFVSKNSELPQVDRVGKQTKRTIFSKKPENAAGIDTVSSEPCNVSENSRKLQIGLISKTSQSHYKTKSSNCDILLASNLTPFGVNESITDNRLIKNSENCIFDQVKAIKNICGVASKRKRVFAAVDIHEKSNLIYPKKKDKLIPQNKSQKTLVIKKLDFSSTVPDSELNMQNIVSFLLSKYKASKVGFILLFAKHKRERSRLQRLFRKQLIEEFTSRRTPHKENAFKLIHRVNNNYRFCNFRFKVKKNRQPIANDYCAVKSQFNDLFALLSSRQAAERQMLLSGGLKFNSQKRVFECFKSYWPIKL